MNRNQATMLFIVIGAIAAVFIIPLLNHEEPGHQIPAQLPGNWDKPQHFELISEEYVLDKAYVSMHGPRSWSPPFSLGEGVEDELVWITGVETQLVDGRTMKPKSAEYMCHANLTIDDTYGAPRHNKAFNNTTNLNRRLFTQVPGRLNIRFPEGYGIPLLSGEEMRYLTMAINLNHREKTEHVRFKTKLHFTPARAAALMKTPMKPLFFRPLYILEPIDLKLTREFETRFKFTFKECEGCAPDRPISASKSSIRVEDGKPATVHWFVHPGKHIYRQRVTKQLNLPFDTTVHYMTGHLHPKAKSIKLRDVTANEDVFISNSKDWADKQGVEHMDELKITGDSKPMFKDHEYELICEYDNDTNGPIDAMAIMYLYLHDKHVELPGR